MPPSKTVHRRLPLNSPPVKGPDVKVIQACVNKQYRYFRIDRAIREDGELGSQTFKAARQIALCMGVVGSGQRKLKRQILSEGTQKLIRGRDKSALEKAAQLAREPYRRRLRARYRQAPGQKAVQAARKLVGIHEEPPGSNWGGLVEKMIRFTGYSEPVYWCGCCACWIVVKLGGAKVPTRIRMGYAPYITEDALAGRNGFTAIPAENARPGDIVCLWGGQHIEVIAEPPTGGSARCIGGNTTAGGKESNGGEVAENTRDLSDFDRGIVARPAY